MSDFVDKFKKSINQGINTVSVKSKEILDSNKVKSEINTLKLEKSNIMLQLGQNVYDTMKSQKFEINNIQEYINRIDEIIRKLDSKNSELEQIHLKAKEEIQNKNNESATPGSAQCKCGAMINMNAKYCPKCGEKNII